MNPIPDLARRLESALRLGTVAAVDHAGARCRVTTGGLHTEWLPWLALRAGHTRSWNPPTPGEQCVVLAPSGEPAAGVVLLGLFSDAAPAPSSDPDETLTVMPDGATLRAGNEVVLDTPQTTSTGRHTIEGLLSYLAGLFGDGCAGGGSVIHGPVTQVGGAITSNGIAVDNHRHAESVGDVTGPPQ
ncbi:phage baseplate assembly protein [Chitiniphilus shinanonensis]|uniref:Phage baseplate assembly protein n=1 Tax=Chitiniphilus shinanonensis TaxID=553088 RepID=A0ABQ6BPC8_9NEIS|nr:phage baseplate assembly protein V [Chitiniphilus shinanonensis]GLS03509.1 phage baseplate assembly protein [Chitiniphilus shinanonensis]